MGKITVRLLPFIPPKYERGEMTLKAKKEFYAMPLEVQKWYKQFNPALGEPEVKDPGDDDKVARAWFSKQPCVLIPSEELVRLPTETYGGDLCFFGDRSEDELREWEGYLESLAPETRNYIESIITQEEEEEEEEEEEYYSPPREDESEKRKTTNDQEY